MTPAPKRKFTAPGLTHSTVHHLLAVAELVERNSYARVADIAKRLEITRGSVSVTMRSLVASGHVRQDENHIFHLTEHGARAVGGIRARHELVEQFFTGVLGLSDELAHRESCRMEYIIEAETARRLLALLQYWRANGLDETSLQQGSRPGCPGCEHTDVAECPCCGLECLLPVPG